MITLLYLTIARLKILIRCFYFLINFPEKFLSNYFYFIIIVIISIDFKHFISTIKINRQDYYYFFNFKFIAIVIVIIISSFIIGLDFNNFNYSTIIAIIT